MRRSSLLLSSPFSFASRFFASLCVVSLCFVSLVVAEPLAAAERTALLSETAVQRHGLTRSWFHQLAIDPYHSEVLHVVLESDTLFVTTDDARIHALNSETGELRWERKIGDAKQITYAPAANSRMVATLNGVSAKVLDRYDGTLLWEAKLPGSPGAGCELSEYYLYAPLMNGRLIAYCLEDQLARNEEEAIGLITQLKPAPDIEIPEKKYDDPELEKIVHSFNESKKIVLPPPVDEPPRTRIVLDRGSSLPLVSQAFGNSWLQPTLCSQSLFFVPPKSQEGSSVKSPEELQLTSHSELVSWATDKGKLFVATIENFSKEDLKMRYNVSVSPQSYALDKNQFVKLDWGEVDMIVARPTFMFSDPPVPKRGVPPKRSSRLLVGTRAGYVFAVNDLTSEVIWHFSANGPVVTRVAGIEDRVYACTQGGGMHALNLDTGSITAIDPTTGDEITVVEYWFAPKVEQFVAASRERIYALDNVKNMVVLDRETGTVLSSFPARDYKICFFNDETDRIYLLTKSGLVQCLRERAICPDPDCDKPLAATGLDECIHIRTALEPLRFRPSCREFVAALRLAGMPPKIEMEEGEGGEEMQDDGEETDPFASTATDPEEEEDGAGENTGEDDDEDADESDPFL